MPIHDEDTISVAQLEQAVAAREMAVQAAESKARQAFSQLRRERYMLGLTRKRLQRKREGKDSRIWLKE